MYDLNIQFLNDNGYIEELNFKNVTYAIFKFYNVTIYLFNEKQPITIKNILDLQIKKIL